VVLGSAQGQLSLPAAGFAPGSYRLRISSMEGEDTELSLIRP